MNKESWMSQIIKYSITLPGKIGFHNLIANQIHVIKRKTLNRRSFSVPLHFEHVTFNKTSRSIIWVSVMPASYLANH